MRNLGLDIIRSLAILLVLVCHTLGMFFSKYDNKMGFMYVTGYLAVELFFVLSGFLIGKILIREIYENGSVHGLKRFYLRRWLRTLPVYYLVVAILIMFFNKRLSWETLFFLQNFKEEALGFMPVSWSLSIEEWFYLLIPLVFIAIGYFLKGKNKARGIIFVVSCLLIIIFEVFIRYKVVMNTERVWDFGVRKQVFLRLDSLVIGVLLAGIRVYFKKLYEILSKPLIAIAGSSGLLYFGGYYLYCRIIEQRIDSDNFSKIFLFSIVSICIAFLIPYFESSYLINNKLSKRKIAKVIEFISVTSYSVYLIHFDIYIYYSSIYNKMIEKFHMYSFLTNLVLSILSQVAVYFLAFAIYKFFEIPILSMRDRITSNHVSKKPSVVS
jgi:peptidoglycan/LPS O-acetylase OafA/YrhL